MNHLEVGALESQALQPTAWDQFVVDCTDLCSEYLHLDHRGVASFDGDQDTDGYSLDWLYTQFNANRTPVEVYYMLESKRVSKMLFNNSLC